MIQHQVVPLVGTWIEISRKKIPPFVKASSPSWGHGLKLEYFVPHLSFSHVVPLVGTWIEIISLFVVSFLFPVVPLVGTWIEIECAAKSNVVVMSSPSWGRGLKYVDIPSVSALPYRRPPRGDVD